MGGENSGIGRGITGYDWGALLGGSDIEFGKIPWDKLPKPTQDKLLEGVLARSEAGAAMAKFAPWGMGIDVLANLGLGITQAIFQGRVIDAQLDYMGHVKTIQTTALNAEITHRSEALKAQKEITILGMGTAERLAQTQAKKEIKLAEIASATKKALYNSQARQQLFLRTRFYGRPALAA